eukprot:12767550-Prorocentrum_lima.AAC.1
MASNVPRAPMWMGLGGASRPFRQPLPRYCRPTLTAFQTAALRASRCRTGSPSWSAGPRSSCADHRSAGRACG